MGQCTVPVSPEVTVVSGTNSDTTSTVGVDFWICSDASGQVFDGSNNSYLVESGASITVIGHFSSIYFKGNTPMTVSGYQNYLTGEDSTAFMDEGSDNIIIECGVGNLVYTYDDAPSDGCSLVGVEDLPFVHYFNTSPNPTNGLLRIGYASARARTIVVSNALGQVALTLPFQQRTDLGALPAGSYVLTVRDANGVALACGRVIRE